jgi:hypothetical protein
VPDSLVDILQTGSVIRVRYIGVDAPEADTPEGQIATRLNRLLVDGKKVYLELDERIWDKYGRLLAYVYLDPDGYLMVNAILILAKIIPNYPPERFAGTDRYDVCFQALEKAEQSSCPLPICQCVWWEEVAKNPKAYEGETLWVCGPVKSAKRLSYGRIFINLGNPYPKTPRFTIMIDEDFTENFDIRYGSRFEEKLMDSVACVYGSIKIYRGVPEIVPTDPDRLRSKVLDNPPPQCCEAVITEH